MGLQEGGAWQEELPGSWDGESLGQVWLPGRGWAAARVLERVVAVQAGQGGLGDRQGGRRGGAGCHLGRAR